MEDKDKIITSLRKQLKDAISRCNALEQENALLSYQLEKRKKECPESRQRQVSRFYRDHEFASSFPRIKGMQEALFGKANGRGYFPVPE